MSRRITVSPQAIRQIDTALQWWTDNRSGVPGLLASEIETAFGRLQLHPTAGEQVRSRHGGSIRRLILRRSRYWLYYFVSENEIEVLALWHQNRGVLPPL